MTMMMRRRSCRLPSAAVVRIIKMYGEGNSNEKSKAERSESNLSEVFFRVPQIFVGRFFFSTFFS